MRLGMLALITAAFIGGYYAYPHWTLHRLDQAIFTGDKETLDDLIDWDRLRGGIKARMRTKADAERAKMAQEFKLDQSDLSPMVRMFSEGLDKMMDDAVNGLVTSECRKAR